MIRSASSRAAHCIPFNIDQLMAGLYGAAIHRRVSALYEVAAADAANFAKSRYKLSKRGSVAV